jgi:hypothetical protein
MSDMSKIQLINNNSKKILAKGTYNIPNIPSIVVIYPKTRVQLFSLENMSGYNIIIDNIGNENKEININKLLKSGTIDTVKSIYVMSNMCKESQFDTIIEGFSKRDVSDSCHYLCSSLNFQNVLIFFIFIILIYYLVSKYSS